MKNLKYKSYLFGDSNIDTLKDSRKKIENKNRLNAFDFGIQNFEPTRVTPVRTTLFLENYHAEKTTLRTTVSYQYTELRSIALKTGSNETGEAKIKVQGLRKIKGGKALNFWFVLDANLRQIPNDATAEAQVASIAEIENG